MSAHDIRQELTAPPSHVVPRRWIHVAAWAVVLTVAAGFRFYDLNVSYWIDEINTHDRAAAGLAHAWADETPLAYVLSWASLSLLGDSEAVLRLPSCLAGIAGVLALLWIATRTGGALCGLLAGLLLATASYHIYWSQLARYYTFTTLFGLGLVWFLHRAIVTRRFTYWLGAALCTTLGALTHLTFLPIAGASFLGTGLYLLKSPRANWLPLCALVLCFVAGMALPASKNLQQVQLMVGISNAEVADTAAVHAESPAPKPTYRLTWDAYQFFLQRYFPAMAGDWRLRYAGIVAGLAGLVLLWRRLPSLAAIVVSCLFLMPLPFMFVDVHHVYYARYFCFVLPLWHLAMAAGAGWLVEVLGRLRFRPSPAGHYLEDREAPPGRARAVVRAVLYVATLAFVVWSFQSGVRESLKDYYGRTPARDWRGMAQAMAPYLQPDDLVLYGNYQEILLERVKFELGFYLDHYTTNGASRGITWQWCKYPADAAEALRANPFRNVWLVGDDTWPDVLEPDFFSGLGKQPKESGEPFGIATLWTFGAPAVNLVATSENTDSPVVLGAVAGSAEFVHEHSWTLLPTRYTVRNASFELFDKETPIGWNADEGSVPYLAWSTAGIDNSHCIKLLPASRVVSLSQPLEREPAPGGTLRIGVQVRSPEAASPQVGLSWTVGGTEAAMYVPITTSPAWNDSSLLVQLPEEFDSGSLVLEVRGGISGTVYIDDIHVEAASRLLEPSQTYTLGLWLKHTNAFRYPYQLKLVGTAADGSPFAHTLIRPPLLSKDWHRAVFRVVPGVDIPFSVDTMKVHCELEENRGQQVWLKELQFELGVHPTPIVVGNRPAHDELLARPLPLGQD